MWTDETRRLLAVAAVAAQVAGALRRGAPLLTALGLAWAGGAAAAGDALPPAAFRPDRLLLLPRDRGGGPALATLHRQVHGEVLRAFPALGGLQVIQVPPATDVPSLVRFYGQSPAVAHAEPDYFVHAVGMPDDPSFTNGTQWALHNTGQGGGLADADVDAPEAWEIQSSAADVVVALVDSGVWTTHEDLAANLWVNPGELPGNDVDDDGNGYVDDVHGLNATTGTGAIRDSAGHGTHLAGVIGAVGNNGRGGAGVAWRVQIMVCRFLGSTGSGSISDAITCLEYARTMGARVINASWVTTNDSTALELALAKARDAGIVVVAAAGNDGADNDRFPRFPPNLTFDNIIRVAASSREDRLWDRSNYGATRVDLVAPGLDIHSTYFIADNNYVAMTGTSQAAAFVAGAAALVRAAFPAASPPEVIDRLLYGSDPVPGLRGKCVTGARLNLRGALDPAPAPIWPRTPVVSAGHRGGRLEPVEQRFVLLNRGPAPVAWSAAVTEPWVQLAPSAGIVGAGEKLAILATLSSEVAGFASGRYTNRIEFVLANLAEPIAVPWSLHIFEPALVRWSMTEPGGRPLRLGVRGHPGASYVAEASATLRTWQAMTTNTLPPGGELPVFWSEPATNVRRYFRVRLGDSP